MAANDRTRCTADVREATTKGSRGSDAAVQGTGTAPTPSPDSYGADDRADAVALKRWAGSGAGTCPASAPDDAAILHDRLAADDGRDRPAAELPAVVEAVVGIRSQLRRDHLALEIQVDDGEVAVVAGADVPLAVVDVEDARRRGGQTLADPLQADAPLVITLGQQHRQDRRGAGKALRGQPDAPLLRRALARHVIGSDDLDRAVCERRPQRVQVVAGPERRVRLPERADVHVERMRQVVRAGLEVDLRVARVPALRLLDRQARRHVRDVDPRAELLREVGGADEVLRLGDRRLRQAPVAQRVPPLLLEPAPDAVDELDVLGVADGHDVAEPRRRLEEIVEVAVVGAVQPEIAPLLALEVHEVLERGDAELRDVPRELRAVQLVRGREMEAEVDVAPLARVTELARVHRVVGLVVEEVAEDGGEPALRRVHRLGRVLGDLLAEAEVHVAVDEAGEDVLARRVDHLRRRGVRAGREQRGEAPVADRDVEARGRAIREHHGAVLHQQIECPFVAPRQRSASDTGRSAPSSSASARRLRSRSASSRSRPMQTRREDRSGDGQRASRSGGWKKPPMA